MTPMFARFKVQIDRGRRTKVAGVQRRRAAAASWSTSPHGSRRRRNRHPTSAGLNSWRTVAAMEVRPRRPRAAMESWDSRD